MSVNMHSLGGTAQPPKRTNVAMSISAGYNLHRAVISPSSHTCDDIGICHHPRLNCSEHTCHKALLDDGVVDIPLHHGTPAPLMDVSDRPPTPGELAWFWSWVAITYLAIAGLGGVIYFFFSDAAVRAFWRVVGYFG